MKHYDTNTPQKTAFEKYGAFFAFTNKRFDEQKAKDMAYTSLGAGLIVPKINARDLLDAINDIQAKKIRYELANNTKKQIIWYHLSNYECQISYDYSDAIDAVTLYGFTEKDVAAEWGGYMQHCIDNDYF